MMSGAPRYIPHYTVSDYQQWEGAWELWQGIPVAMTPSPFGPHQRCSLRLARALLAAVEAAGCQAEVLQEIDWIISDDTVVRPDVIVLCGAVPEKHVTRTPAIVAEILSPSTADRDRNEKRQLFEEQGVEHYLVMDPKDTTIDYYLRDASGKLSLIEQTEILELVICSDCRLALNVATVAGS